MGFFRKNLVGLDIGISGIKAVELEGRKSTRLVAYNRVPLPFQAIIDGEIRDRDVVIDALKNLFGATNFHTKKVAVGTGGNSVITKKITVPKMTEEELNQQLYWEAEQYIPFNVNDVNLDYAILGPSHQSGGSNTPMMDVIIVAARKDYIENLNGVLDDAGLTPVVVDLQAFALGNVFEFNYTHLIESAYDAATILIDFGAGSTKVAVVEGDKTTFAREIKLCGTSCTLLLSERLGLSFDEAEKAKISGAHLPEVKTILEQHLESIAEEIHRTIDLALSQGADRVIQGIYICGGSSKIPGLIEILEGKLPSSVKILNPIQNIAGSGAKMSAAVIRELSYLGSVAIGLALRYVGDT